MKTLDEVINAYEKCIPLKIRCNECPYHEDGCPESRKQDALHYLKEYRVVTDICHEHGIASVWGQVLPDVEKTDWDKRLNFDNAYDNKPLDWDELRQMEGKPVWVEALLYKQWAVIAYVSDGYILFEGVNLYAPESRIYMGEENGWQAYRKERYVD